MAFLRPISSLRSVALLRPAMASIRPALPFAASHTRFYASGYGDGKGDPAGENPQKQPAAKSRDIEHPGPPPPDVGKGTDASARKPDGKDTNNSGGEKKSQSSQSVKGAEPKILNENPPSPSEQDADVKQHNKEMENRAERADTKIGNEDAEKDKVSPEFWSGHGGTKGG